MAHPLIQKPVNVGKRIIYRFEKWLYFKSILDTSQLVLPDFMGIGVEKAGTTWLYENLKCHPDLFLPERKELNFFSNTYRFYGMPLEDYAAYFIKPESIQGEITPCANLSSKRIRFIHTVNPSLKLILILRNPIDRIWAAGLMRLVNARKRPFESITDPEWKQLFTQHDLFSRGDYPSILNRWRSIFPSHQLHVCFYDDIVRDSHNFLVEVFRFLGVSETVNWLDFPIQHHFNKSPEYKMPSTLRQYLHTLYQESLCQLQVEFPRVSAWLE